jgi:hypothetical protein
LRRGVGRDPAVSGFSPEAPGKNVGRPDYSLIMPGTVRRRRLRRGAITGAVEAWLPDPLVGADAVRREVALRLALELDTHATPAHAIPRTANALLSAIAAIAGDEQPHGDLDVRALLAEALR